MQVIEGRFGGQRIDEILRDLYIRQRLTVEEVGAELRIDPSTVSRWLAHCGIPARRTGPSEAVA